MPSQWMAEMAAAQNGGGAGPEHASGAPGAVRNKPPAQRGAAERRDDEVVEADGASDSLVRMLLPFASMALTVLVGVLSWYMMRHRMPRKAAVKGITTSIMLDWDITNVYDYVSTPDFRTEWHMAAVEVNGPAIDHSAVTGARPDLATQAASCAACAPSSPPSLLLPLPMSLLYTLSVDNSGALVAF